MSRTVLSNALSMCLQAFNLNFNKCGDFHFLMIDGRSLHNREVFRSTCEILRLNPNNQFDVLYNICQLDSMDIKEHQLMDFFKMANLLPAGYQLHFIVLSIAVFDNELVFNYCAKQDVSKNDVEKYLDLKKNVESFLLKIAKNIELEKIWVFTKKTLKKPLKKDENHKNINKNEIDCLCKLFEKYVQPKIQHETRFKQNINHILAHLNYNHKAQQIKPLLLFLIFIKNTEKLLNKDIVDDLKIPSLENYEKCKGKSHTILKEYQKKIQLFCELLKFYNNTVSIALCLYGFRKISALYGLLYRDVFSVNREKESYDYSGLEKIGFAYDFYIFFEKNHYPSFIEPAIYTPSPK